MGSKRKRTVFDVEHVAMMPREIETLRKDQFEYAVLRNKTCKIIQSDNSDCTYCYIIHTNFLYLWEVKSDDVATTTYRPSCIRLLIEKQTNNDSNYFVRVSNLRESESLAVTLVNASKDIVYYYTDTSLGGIIPLKTDLTSLLNNKGALTLFHYIKKDQFLVSNQFGDLYILKMVQNHFQVIVVSCVSQSSTAAASSSLSSWTSFLGFGDAALPDKAQKNGCSTSPFLDCLLDGNRMFLFNSENQLFVYEVCWAPNEQIDELRYLYHSNYVNRDSIIRNFTLISQNKFMISCQQKSSFIFQVFEIRNKKINVLETSVELKTNGIVATPYTMVNMDCNLVYVAYEANNMLYVHSLIFPNFNIKTIITDSTFDSCYSSTWLSDHFEISQHHDQRLIACSTIKTTANINYIVALNSVTGNVFLNFKRMLLFQKILLKYHKASAKKAVSIQLGSQMETSSSGSVSKVSAFMSVDECFQLLQKCFRSFVSDSFDTSDSVYQSDIHLLQTTSDKVIENALIRLASETVNSDSAQRWAERTGNEDLISEFSQVLVSRQLSSKKQLCGSQNGIKAFLRDSSLVNKVSQEALHCLNMIEMKVNSLLHLCQLQSSVDHPFYDSLNSILINGMKLVVSNRKNFNEEQLSQQLRLISLSISDLFYSKAVEVVELLYAVQSIFSPLLSDDKLNESQQMVYSINEIFISVLQYLINDDTYDFISSNSQIAWIYSPEFIKLLESQIEVSCGAYGIKATNNLFHNQQKQLQRSVAQQLVCLSEYYLIASKCHFKMNDISDTKQYESAKQLCITPLIETAEMFFIKKQREFEYIAKECISFCLYLSEKYIYFNCLVRYGQVCDFVSGNSRLKLVNGEVLGDSLYCKNYVDLIDDSTIQIVHLNDNIVALKTVKNLYLSVVNQFRLELKHIQDEDSLTNSQMFEIQYQSNSQVTLRHKETEHYMSFDSDRSVYELKTFAHNPWSIPWFTLTDTPFDSYYYLVYTMERQDFTVNFNAKQNKVIQVADFDQWLLFPRYFFDWYLKNDLSYVLLEIINESFIAQMELNDFITEKMNDEACEYQDSLTAVYYLLLIQLKQFPKAASIALQEGKKQSFLAKQHPLLSIAKLSDYVAASSEDALSEAISKQLFINEAATELGYDKPQSSTVLVKKCLDHDTRIKDFVVLALNISHRESDRATQIELLSKVVMHVVLLERPHFVNIQRAIHAGQSNLIQELMIQTMLYQTLHCTMAMHDIKLIEDEVVPQISDVLSKVSPEGNLDHKTAWTGLLQSLCNEVKQA